MTPDTPDFFRPLSQSTDRAARRVLAAILGAGLLVTPAAGHARSKLQGVGQASLGYTDNVRSAPDDPVLDPETGEVLLAGKKSSFFTTLSPGLVYGIETDGAMHRFSYTYASTFFFGNSSANTYSNRLEWRGFMEPMPRLQLIMSSAVTQSHRQVQGSLLSSSETALTAALPGTGAYVLATADEAASYRLSQDWSLIQGLGGAAQVPVFDTDGPKTYQLSGQLGLERLWEYTAAGVEARERYVTYRRGALTADGRAGKQSQSITELVGTLRHDFSYEISGRAEAGAANVFLIERDRRFWQPVGLVALSYVRDEGVADLMYRHAVTTSVFLGLTFLTDELRLHGSIPLDKHEKVWVAASTGYQRSRILDVDGELATHLKLALGDVSVGYRILDQLELAARYQHAEQISGADQPPLPLSYVRNSAFITATVEYPPDREMPRVYREARRVDRSDAIDASQQQQPGTMQPGGAQR